MADTLTSAQLQTLRAGDRITYYGVRWQVGDHSTYTDAKGYATEEWLLRSTTGKEYYLLKEIDPASTGGERWYIAEALPTPKIIDPSTQTDVLTSLGATMRSAQTPYPQLQLFNRLYQFESATEGTYESDDGAQQRITWDYWDAAHLWNLALEAWSKGKLVVYSTREVQPESFSEYRMEGEGIPQFSEQGVGEPSILQPKLSGGLSRQTQFFWAWGLVIAGFFLMMMGI
jgi:Domain of unknown function (DUF4178)